MSLKDIASSVAQQLMCALTTADVHMSNTCCAYVTQLLGGKFTPLVTGKYKKQLAK